MSARPAVLVTGGAKRVGAVLCEHFARAGYDVALHCHRSAGEAKDVQARVQALGARCEIFSQDLADMAALPGGLVRAAKQAFPALAVLINNASIFERAPFMDTDEALFDRQVGVNFKAPFFLTQAFAREVGQGAVINMLDTDVAGTQGSHFIYLQSKKMLAEFTRMAARELGPDLRVNGVCPGPMLPADGMDEAYFRRLAPTLPARRIATPAETAEAALWLAQQPAITGQLVFVDGGQHLL